MEVSPNEYVLRRIHRDHCDLTSPIPVLLAAFRPNKMDVTGLSIFREKLISAAQVAASGRKLGEYFVARLLVQDICDLQLSVIEEEQKGLAGHAAIPQLTYSAYGSDKEQWKPILLELAKLASKQIVFAPKKGS